ncbi:MAG: ABC transporter permease [Longimicrobiales bacterium]
MNIGFAGALAWRESRSSWRRIGLYMTSITLGVAALVAINSFRQSMIESVKLESRALLGADLRLFSSRPFPPAIQAMIDSTVSRGFVVSNVTNMVSMANAPRSQRVRMVQLRAVNGGFPFYGEVKTQPAGLWRRLHEQRWTVVDPALLAQLQAQVGDTLRIGEASFVIAGTIEKLPADMTFRSALGPRVAIAGAYLQETGLERFGSMSQRQAYFRVANEKVLEDFVQQRRPLLRQNMVGFDTAREQSEDLVEALDAMARFLGLVGLAALLLGGVGVASAVHVFIREKRPTVAMLRCLGATQQTVFLAYLLQAVALGFSGALAGVLLGLGIQAFLPSILQDMLPVSVHFRVDVAAIATGLGVGVWVAGLFALIPLLSIRGISPLQALRREYDVQARRWDWMRLAALVALGGSIGAISLWQAADWRPALAFTGGLTGALLLLWLTAWALTRATRRFFPRRARFVVRQGVGSLFRPHNQTVAVVLGLGFGVFIIGTVYLVQTNLLGWLRVENQPDAPNMVAFDIQRDQVETVRTAARGRAVAPPRITPLVTARITHLKGRRVEEVLADTTAGRRIEGWAVRREYRHTYRDTMVESETLVSGTWFGSSASARQSPVEISMEEDVAESLKLSLGDRVTWDFQGILIETRVTSLRRVQWARFATNFFVVFPNGVLDEAPQNFVALMRVDDAEQRAIIQRELVDRHSNITVIDVAQVQAAFQEIVDKVSLAIRFMALFSTMAGLIVLIGAVATSRFQRMREAVLLKTIGATRKQVLGVLITEYTALGALAGMTGLILAGIAGWLLTRFFFELEFTLPIAALAITWALVALVAVGVGLANSLDMLKRPPLAVLREAD